MNDDLIAEFKDFAAEVLHTHTEELKNKYSLQQDFTTSRLQVFNEHLSLLKEELQQKMSSLFRKAKTAQSSHLDQLQQELFRIYNEVVNSFLSKDFNQ